MALWLESGAPLPDLLRALADEHPQGSARGLVRVAERVERGEGLADAVAAERSALPGALRQRLASVASAGALRVALPAMAMEEAADREARARWRAELAYPAVVASFALAVLWFLSVFLVPPFRDIYQEFELELPAMTEAVLAAARAAPWLAAATITLAVGLLALGAAPATRPAVHRLCAALPLVGPARVALAHQSFARLLAGATRGGATLDEALQATAAALADRGLALATGAVADRCAAGVSLADALAESRHFDRALVAMVRWGESRGDLAGALDEAAQRYGHEAELALSFASRVAPPLVLIGVVATVALVVGALFIPLVKLIESLS